MRENRGSNTRLPTSTTWVWLAMAVLVTVFSNGRWIIPVATWVAPVFFLRYIHSQKKAHGILLGGVSMAFIQLVAWNDMTPLSDDFALYVLIFSWIVMSGWLALIICLSGVSSMAEATCTRRF